MKPEELQDAIGKIGDDMIDDARKPEKAKRKEKRPLLWAGAATLAVCILLTAIIMPAMLIHKGAESGKADTEGQDVLKNEPTDTEASDDTEKQEDTEAPKDTADSPEVPDTPVGDGTVAEKVKTLSLAYYPEEAMYPTDTSDPKFYSQHSDWSSAKREQIKLYRESLPDISEYIRKSGAELLKGDGENLVYSPLNVYLALCMLCETTDGNTRAQILDLLGATDIESLRESAEVLWRSSYRNDGIVTSIPASSVWLDSDFEPRTEPLEILAAHYFASAFLGEMGSAEYDNAMKEWINEQTGGLLADQLNDLHMDPSTVMALMTTVYFKASWSEEFAPERTELMPFYSPDGEISCEFLNQTLSASYYEGEDFKAMSMNFEAGGDMWILLPDEGVAAEELLCNEESLGFITGETQKSREGMLYRRLALSLPKFDVNSDIDLKEGLRALGVTDVFTEGVADYSPLTDEDIVLTDARHSARVKIDEEGCEAAAVTIMQAGPAGEMAEVIDFTVDRPFIFVITSDVDLPLFVGVVNIPA